MEIALNPESKRKSSVAVAIKDDERTFGSDALAVGVKKPEKCYFYLLDLVGKPFDHPSVKLYQQRFPYYKLEADPERGTVLFRYKHITKYLLLFFEMSTDIFGATIVYYVQTPK